MQAPVSCQSPTDGRERRKAVLWCSHHRSSRDFQRRLYKHSGLCFAVFYSLELLFSCFCSFSLQHLSPNFTYAQIGSSEWTLWKGLEWWSSVIRSGSSCCISMNLCISKEDRQYKMTYFLWDIQDLCGFLLPVKAFGKSRLVVLGVVFFDFGAGCFVFLFWVFPPAKVPFWIMMSPLFPFLFKISSMLLPAGCSSAFRHVCNVIPCNCTCTDVCQIILFKVLFWG